MFQNSIPSPYKNSRHFVCSFDTNDMGGPYIMTAMNEIFFAPTPFFFGFAHRMSTAYQRFKVIFEEPVGPALCEYQE
jgi:hypothetical protein